MDDRKDLAVQQIISELKMLRKNQGIDRISYSTTQILKLIIGEEIGFNQRIIDTIELYVDDEISQECVIIALSLDDADSLNLTQRRRAAAEMFQISERTVSRLEDKAFWRIARGIVKAHWDVLDVFFEDKTKVRDINQLSDRIDMKVQAIERELVELKSILGQLKTLT